MNKILLTSIIVLCLVGCKPGSENIDNRFSMPAELQDCSIFKLSSTASEIVTVVRCPNSSTSTTYKNGKATQTTVVVDGETYTKVEK